MTSGSVGFSDLAYVCSLGLLSSIFFHAQMFKTFLCFFTKNIRVQLKDSEGVKMMETTGELYITLTAVTLQNPCDSLTNSVCSFCPSDIYTSCSSIRHAQTQIQNVLKYKTIIPQTTFWHNPSLGLWRILSQVS